MHLVVTLLNDIKCAIAGTIVIDIGVGVGIVLSIEYYHSITTVHASWFTKFHANIDFR